MSIKLVTGLPGNGKTLYALFWVKQWAEREGRPVFYAGIKGLKLPWQTIDPYNWRNAPAGAIVVIDEAQRAHDPEGKKPLFAPCVRNAVPAWVADLTVHRHGGVDLVLITQHPSLLDTSVRRLVDHHLHVVRRWGLQAATVHEWRECRDDCNRRRADSSKTSWRFPREVYGWYESAEAHTMKVRIPWRVWGLGVVLLALIGLVWFVGSRILGQVTPKGAPGQASHQVASPGPMPVPNGGQGLRAPGQAGAQPLGRYEWVAQWEPRVQGLGYTAPAYDELTKPVEVPYPAACVVMRKECRCYTQQATRLDVPEPLCRSIVDRGFFVGWRGQVRDQARPVAVAASVPSPAAPPGGGAIIIGDEPRGPAAAQRVSVLAK